MTTSPAIHSGIPFGLAPLYPAATTNRNTLLLVCPQALGPGPYAVLCRMKRAPFALSKTLDLVRVEPLGRESHSAPSSPSERQGVAQDRGDLSCHSKAVFGAPSCGRSQPALPNSLAFTSNNSNNYSRTQSRCTRIRGR